MGQGILIHLLQVAMTVIQVNVISGLPHLCTQRLEIFHRFSFAFSAFFAVEPIWRLRTVQTKRTQRSRDRILRRLNRKELKERRDSGQKERGLALAAGLVLFSRNLLSIESP